MNNIVPRMVATLGRWETCALKSYKDTDGTWHVGYGHGNANNHPPFVDEHTVLKDEAEAMAILISELTDIYAPQLNKMLAKIDCKLNDNQYCGLLDVLYNRGAGRLRESKAWDWLTRPSEPNYLKECARAIVFSHVDGFTPLDVSVDRVTGVERVYLGLTLRRIDDASLFLARQ